MNPAGVQKKNLKTLVIGGAGYIGSHLVPLLTATGRQVTIMGRRANPTYRLPQSASYVQGDFGQPDLLRCLLDSHHEVIHMAYATAPNTSFDNPVADLLQNLPPTAQLLTQAAQRECKLILISSGGTVYGEALHLPIAEDHPTRPIAPYGVTKLSIETYAHMYSITHGLNYICVRPANAFGVGQRPFAGQGFISTAIATSMLGEVINIYGQNGTVRDYIYVADLASGIVSILEQGVSRQTYNIGSGIGLSNVDVIKLITPIMNEIGHDVRVAHLADRPFDVKANVLDVSKIKQQTGWSPQVDLLEGLRLTRDWIKGGCCE